RCRTTLAAYLPDGGVRARISARARPRTGRIRSIGVGSIAPFLPTEPTTPAAHAQPDASARESVNPSLTRRVSAAGSCTLIIVPLPVRDCRARSDRIHAVLRAGPLEC